MADQTGEFSVKNTLPLEKTFSDNAVKEECKDEDFVDDKIQISETTITFKMQDNLICDNRKPYNISTTLDNTKAVLSLPEMKYDNPKIKGISTDNTKIKFNNKILYCEDCQVYYEDYCTECKMLVYVLNKTVLINIDIKSEGELPNNILKIRNYFGEYHIFASKVIPIGVKFGPFTGLDTAADPWKIKSGKFVVNKDKSKYLNWMQYINLARNISEQNLQVFQYEHNLYYESTRQIKEGDELLVHFGEEYKESLNINIEMNLIPTRRHIFKNVFACTFCSLGFSSKSYLVKHKTICPRITVGGFSIEVLELTQCPFCKIHLDQKEYLNHHMAYCCEINDRKCILPTQGCRAVQVNGRKTRSRPMYECQQCKYKTKYKGHLKNHANLHYQVKMYKCGVCCGRFKTKEVLRRHMDNTHICADAKKDLNHSTGVNIKAHIKTEHSCSQDEMKPFKCSLCEFRTKYKPKLNIHIKRKHLKEFNYKCDICAYKAIFKSSLKTHLETKHLKVFKYKCETCDYQTNWKSDLKKHVEARHLREFKYKCGRCDYKTNRTCYLKTHVETKHLKKFKYKCDKCDYKTNRACYLKTHVDTKHLKEFKYKCDTCGYKTNLKFELKRHIEAKHLKIFKYTCDGCDYKTNWKSNLKTHTETNHSNELKYKCDACDYKTNRIFNLKAHISAKHLNAIKYKCDGCNYETNYKSCLSTHIKTQHLKEFKYKCDTCDYKTNDKSKIKRHTDARHLK